MTGETPVLFVDVARELILKQHADKRARLDDMKSVPADAAASQAQVGALQAIGQEALAPYADVATGALGTLVKAAGITLLRKYKSHVARQKVAPKLSRTERRAARTKQRAKQAATKRAARRIMMRGIVLESIAKKEGTAEHAAKSKAERRKEYKAKIAQVSRALIVKAIGKSLRSNGRDLTAGVVATQVALNAPAALAAKGLITVGLATSPVGGFVLGTAAFIATSVMIDRAVRYMTGGDTPLTPLFDYAVTSLLQKDKRPEALTRMKSRYRVMAQNLFGLKRPAETPHAPQLSAALVR